MEIDEMKTLKDKLKGKNAIVTGGSEGIGVRIAEGLLRHGAKVYIVSKTEGKLQDAQKHLSKFGEVEYRVGDITQLGTIISVIDEVHNSAGGLNIFVNNAGKYLRHTYESQIDQTTDFRRLIGEAPSNILHYLVRKFAQNGDTVDVITNVSQGGLSIFDHGLAYGPGKWELASSVWYHRADLENPDNPKPNVRLWSVYPGTVRTENTQAAIDAGDLRNPIEPEPVVDVFMDMAIGKLPYESPYKDVRVVPNKAGNPVREYFTPAPPMTDIKRKKA
ncbi:MAG: SDR family NAD(P)-dependent oxidoreductase [Candidatus Nanoarchaeia archaeon]